MNRKSIFFLFSIVFIVIFILVFNLTSCSREEPKLPKVDADKIRYLLLTLNNEENRYAKEILIYSNEKKANLESYEEVAF
ncbi:MAG TPA: hypothetical protein GXX15_06500 [Clostridia bacterium]|nr:hypothetical protein [Clostridia bacterium]